MEHTIEELKKEHAKDLATLAREIEYKYRSRDVPTVVAIGLDQKGKATSTKVQALVGSQWTQFRPLPQPVRYAAAARIGHTIYVTGGEMPSGDLMVWTNAMISLSLGDDAKKEWVTEAPMPVAMAQHNSFVSDGKLYCVSGRCVQYYDPATKRWTVAQGVAANKGAIVTQQACVGHTDGRFCYLLGGLVDGEESDVCEVYDVSLNVWGSLPPLPMSRFSHRAFINNRGNIVVLGGLNRREFTRVVLEFNPATRTWSTLSWSLRNYRSDFALHYNAEDDALTLVGGQNGSNKPTRSVCVRLADGGVWKDLPPLPTAMRFVTYC